MVTGHMAFIGIIIFSFYFVNIISWVPIIKHETNKMCWTFLVRCVQLNDLSCNWFKDELKF